MSKSSSTYAHEKDGLPAPAPSRQAPRRGLSRGLAFLLAAVCAGIALYTLGPPCLSKHFESFGEVARKEELCPQEDPLVPSTNGELWKGLSDKYSTNGFLLEAVEWLGGAVRVPTESYDQMLPVGQDPRWEVFTPFHDYLLSAFPNVHATLKLTKVNTYGLVYVWEGSDASLKPLLLTAHQDVVPVNPESLNEWTHPPFSGYYDGERVWGRGSSDDKSGLIGLMTTVETLIKNDFKPTRTVFLAFGFDEEASGLHGATAIGKYLLETYGENAFSLLVDEGGDYSIEYGQAYATVGTAEKGYFDVRVEVTSPGGHSSVPPAHTSIGILAQLLVHVEAHPYKAELKRGTPMYQKTQCLAAYAGELPSKVRKAIERAGSSDKALRAAEKALFADPRFKALVGTTSAVDLIAGGVKTNALPESAWAVVNHRIATDSSVGAVQEHDADLLHGLARHFNLSYTAFGEQISEKGAPAYGSLTLSDAWGAALEPAPITPSAGEDAGAFRLLAGTIKTVYRVHRNVTDDETVIVSPGIMSGNTDTRHYWPLTKNIFRYSHSWSGDRSWLSRGVHTVNEAIYADQYLEMIRFFTTLILNADESRAI
ncbi:carboxypeptidase S [Phanerochaete sordida]|uniref:Carboxypeptidase S n=1 Tax=Phanerochaete sordida TaxID=48140 RepID=A0A9P3GBQ6_9APHY|nr:carboxypeptidase S [Phanerochaete sordida]